MWKFLGRHWCDQTDKKVQGSWEFELLGPVDEKLLTPTCIAVSETGEFVVSDTESCFIVIYDNNGKYLSHFSTIPKFRLYIFQSLDKYRPQDVAWLSTKRLAYTQPKGSKVTVSDWKGNVKTCIQGRPLYEPFGIDVDMYDRIFVCDRAKGRILCYNSDGKLLKSFGAFCSHNIQLCKPHYIAIDGSGNIFVNDIQQGNIIIIVYTDKGNVIDCLTTDLPFSDNLGSLAVDKVGKMFQVDTREGCIVVIKGSTSDQDAEHKHIKINNCEKPSGIAFSPECELVCIDQKCKTARIESFRPISFQHKNGVIDKLDQNVNETLKDESTIID